METGKKGAGIPIFTLSASEWIEKIALLTII